jgi:arylsulfatase A-like enzyme
MGEQGSWNKQQPYEESIRVPFLLYHPSAFGTNGKASTVLLNTPDIMPTLLGFTRLPIPSSVEGKDLSQVISGKKKDTIEETLISCVQPFGQWSRRFGGKEYRGLVTRQYTYARDLKGAWLLFDNNKDPLQLNNLIGNPDFKKVQQNLDERLTAKLRERKDEFLPGMEYVKKWNYVVDSTETVPYIKMNYEGKPIME